MAQINFPVATAAGQIFEADTGVLYTYVGTPPNGYWSGTFGNDGTDTLDARYVKKQDGGVPQTIASTGLKISDNNTDTIVLNGNGSATFAGQITTGDGTASPGTSGVGVGNPGYVSISQSARSSQNCISIYDTTNAISTFSVTGAGSASFASEVVAGVRDQNCVLMTSAGTTQGVSGGVSRYALSGADGSATFKGNVNIGDTTTSSGGTQISAAGYLYLRSAAGDAATPVIDVYNLNNTKRAAINADGSIVTRSSLSAADGYSGINSSGTIYANRANGSDVLFSGATYGGGVTSSIAADGSAQFNNLVIVGSNSPNTATGTWLQSAGGIFTTRPAGSASALFAGYRVGETGAMFVINANGEANYKSTVTCNSGAGAQPGLKANGNYGGVNYASVVGRQYTPGGFNFAGRNGAGTATFSVTDSGSVSLSGALTTPGLNSTSAGSYNITWSSASNQIMLETSSIRYKTNVETADNDICLDIVKRSRPVLYHSTLKTDNPDLSHWGFIAEEVHEIDPRLVNYNDEGVPDGVVYNRYAPVLMNVLQQALARIESLEAQVNELKASQG